MARFSLSSALLASALCFVLIATLTPIKPTSSAATPAARRWLLSVSDLKPDTVSSVLKVYKDAGMTTIAKRTKQVSIGSFNALILPAGGPEIRKILQSTMSNKVLSIDNEVTWKLFATQANPPPGLDRLDTPSGALDRSFSFPDNAGEGVDMYVIDSGIDVNHADFGGRAQFLADFSGEGASDLNGHGTHCASTAAGSRFGIAKQANIFAAKVFDASGSGSNFGVVQALQAVARSVQQRRNPSVVNMSLGGPRGGDAATQRAIDSLVQLGAAVVVAAGNESQDACNVSPAFIPSAITVAANNPRDNRFANFSNRGRCVDIVAPGVQIEAARANSQSASTFLSGTSMASPHVAGIMAALMSQGQSRSQAQQTLLASAVPNVVVGAPANTRNLLAQLPPV